MGDATDAAKAFFDRHAEAYARSDSHRTGHDLDMLIDALRPLSGMTALDVATGAGFVAVAMAEAGARVTAVDVAPAMLRETGRLAAQAGVAVSLLEARADALPLADATVDRVASRRAAHHFDRIDDALAEWRRVLRPGGWAAVADVSPPAPAAEFQDAVERLRDGSHRRALPPQAWAETLEAAGFERVSRALQCERVGLERWLYPVEDTGVRAAVEAALAHAPATAAAAMGLRREGDGSWSFVRQRVVVRGRRPID